VCQTRAEGLGLVAEVVDEGSMAFGKDVCGVLVQYPDTTGSVNDYKVRTLSGCSFVCCRVLPSYSKLDKGDGSRWSRGKTL
jgi:hypothetical protein